MGGGRGEGGLSAFSMARAGMEQGREHGTRNCIVLVCTIVDY